MRPTDDGDANFNGLSGAPLLPESVCCLCLSLLAFARASQPVAGNWSVSFWGLAPPTQRGQAPFWNISTHFGHQQRELGRPKESVEKVAYFSSINLINTRHSSPIERASRRVASRRVAAAKSCKGDAQMQMRLRLRQFFAGFCGKKGASLCVNSLPVLAINDANGVLAKGSSIKCSMVALLVHLLLAALPIFLPLSCG